MSKCIQFVYFKIILDIYNKNGLVLFSQLNWVSLTCKLKGIGVLWLSVLTIVKFTLLTVLGAYHSLSLTRLMIQFSLVTQSCPTLCDPMDCSTPGFPITNSQSLLKLMYIESVLPSNHLILCRPLLLLPSIFPSIRVFSNESVLHIR